MKDDADAPGEAYREVIREKDAQIDRLVFKLAKQEELITELANALVNDDQNYVWYNEGDDLIQRAREATR